MLNWITRVIMKLAGVSVGALEKQFNAIESESPLSKKEKDDLEKLHNRVGQTLEEVDQFLEDYRKEKNETLDVGSK